MLSIRTRLLIDKICDQAESEWKTGFQPEISKLIEQVDEEAVPFLLTELIRVDREINDREEEELRQYYLGELPTDYQDLVAKALADDLQLSRFDELISIDEDDAFEPEEYIGKSIGNYRIDRILGVGGFGMVYRAKDKILNRHVVIKIPRGWIFQDNQGIDAFLDEAKKISGLRHENILKVLHVDRESGRPYIVEEYFKDGDLAKLLQNGIPDTSYTLKFIQALADAIQYAHDNDIIHRDLKPANILIGINGEPVVGDFGLSLCAAQISETSRQIAGTVQYMSPEQIRGETHRLDGRTDIWSIGVILYRMLTGQLPFEGPTSSGVAKKIIFGRPIEPRQLAADIGEELNRICMRCLSQRVIDRYENAAELSDDLCSLISDGSNGVTKVAVPRRIRAKGLASFGTEDRDFFLSLLPGPTSRNGFPECIDFWKRRIERVELSQPVAIILGPSGSGKSSMVHAGLLPFLNDQIEVVTVDATGDDTEVRLLKGLRAQFPELPHDISLPMAIAGMREGRWLDKDRRLLIVLDQFEQWLHGNSTDEHHQLIHALRHCDGESVMSLILAREDFFMAVSKFFSHLEVDLVARKNFAAVELFDHTHGRRILTKFGQSLKKLPPKEADFTDDQNEFLDRSISLISVDQRIMCVRLTIFVEAIKHLPWTTKTLDRIGNAKEIGIYFLEQNIGEKCGNPKHRGYRKPLINVLEELLPDPGVEIKGTLRSKQELAQAAGLHVESSEFKTVLRILDNELRLITPTDPDGEFADNSTGEKSFFQLTHDYLVPSLRDWMESVRGQSRQGRARLRLQQLARAWESTNDSRFMPSFFDYASIVWHVPNQKRSANEQAFMKAAGTHFGNRTLALLAVACTIFFAFWWLNGLKNQELTRNRVDQFISSKPAKVVRITEQLRANSQSAIDEFNSRLARVDLKQQEELRVNMGLAMLGQTDRQRMGYLIKQIPHAADSECLNFINALKIDSSAIRLLDEEIDSTDRLPAWARLVIVRGFLNPESFPDVFAFRENPEQRTALIHEFANWHGELADFEMLLEIDAAAGYLSGLCLSLGQIESGELGIDVVEKITNQLLDLYTKHPSSAVHSAAGWALRSWKVELPELSESFNLAQNEWWIDESGLTMAEYLTTDPTGKHYPLSISTSEIPSWLFDEFLNDTQESPDDRAKTDWKMTNPEYPVTRINLEDAVLFCNWLSEKHGRKKCYEFHDEHTPEFLSRDRVNWIRMKKWRLVEDANGYRLPWWHEWQCAASGGTTTKFFYADLGYFPGHDRYQWYRANSKAKLKPIAKLFPNQYGLFDILGNVSEVTWGIGVGGAATIRDSECVYAVNGGDYLSSEDRQSVKKIFETGLDRRYDFNGFRIVVNR